MSYESDYDENAIPDEVLDGVKSYITRLKAQLEGAGITDKDQLRAELRDRIEPYYQAKRREYADGQVEYYPHGLSDPQKSAIEVDRSTRGLPPLQNKTVKQLPRPISPQHAAAIEISRASMGQSKLSSDDIARMQSAPDQDDQTPEYAPRGTSKIQVKQEELRRATYGGRPYLQHPDDVKKGR